MRIAVLRENLPGESRVALVPESVRKLVGLKVSVAVERGAGEQAGAADDDYLKAGAEVLGDRDEILESADVLAALNLPSSLDLSLLKKGAIVLGFLRPLDEPAALEPIVSKQLTAFAMELVPRITRAQSMDALSSMATVVGYKAVILAAEQSPRMFPMLMTAAGTVPPARVLVLGAGVAGLQAIATARRLGAVVEAYDIRAAAGEQVRSLGATFLDVDLGGIQTEDAGGYAVELTEEAINRGKEVIAKQARTAAVVITTAQVPGRHAPLLITAETVSEMRRGAVIVDLAGATGGNCALSVAGESVESNGVTILSPLNLAATVPVHASQLYSRNLTAFLALLIKDGQLVVDMSDDIIKPSCVTYRGEYIHPRVAAALEETVRR